MHVAPALSFNIFPSSSIKPFVCLQEHSRHSYGQMHDGYKQHRRRVAQVGLAVAPHLVEVVDTPVGERFLRAVELLLQRPVLVGDLDAGAGAEAGVEGGPLAVVALPLVVDQRQPVVTPLAPVASSIVDLLH